MSSRQSKPRLRDATKRWKTISIREPQESDWPYFWGAYKSGMWTDFEEDMDLDGFKRRFTDFAGAMPDFYVAACGVAGHGQVPVGIILSRNGGDHPAIHAVWFKWAKPRQIIESAAKFLCLLRDQHIMGFVQHDIANRQFDHFFRYLADVGLIRRVGRVKHLYGPNRDSLLYQMTRKI